MSVLSIHIVRRYGPVGGMENYVYELTQALAQQQQLVMVLCEQCCVPDGVDLPFEVMVLGNRFSKPRWLAQWGFAQRVKAYIKKQQSSLPCHIIHSHERTGVHHVTTFHGPPFLLRKKRLLDVLSPRIHMWTQLEAEELLSPQVEVILPNSPLIAEQLSTLYPSVVHKIQAPAYPGVDARFNGAKRLKQEGHPYTVGFLGREWHRKGLDIAVATMAQLRCSIPSVRFIVAGCEPAEIQHLFNDFPEAQYELMGWVDDPLCLLSQVDMLLHPARAEPFGMVIAEANAVGLPVVVSDQCGAGALVGPGQGQVCAIDAPIDLWAKACEKALLDSEPVASMDLTWQALATQHIEIYHSVAERLAVNPAMK